MKWLTWEYVGVDRMACAWLIRRFIDPQAEFLFIPQGQNPNVAGYEAFDIPSVRLSHWQGHCTFWTFLREYALTDPILHRIAHILDEADLVQDTISLEPAAAGLDLICTGLRRISADDYIAIERGALIYDALYAQLAAES